MSESAGGEVDLDHQNPVGEHPVDDAADQRQHTGIGGDDQRDVAGHQQMPLHGSHSADIKSCLIDGLRGQGILLRNPDGEDKWLRFTGEHCMQIVERLMQTPGIAITPLPEPDSTRYEGDEHEPQARFCWMPGDDFEVSVWDQGEIQRFGLGWGDLEPISATEARTIAAALLAAAVQAQEEQ